MKILIIISAYTIAKWKQKVLGKKTRYTNKKSYQEKQGRYLPFSAQDNLIYRFHDYLRNGYMGWKF